MRDHRADATWHRGHVAAPQVAHRARTRGKRPHRSTRVHADARVGCHVVGGRCMEGPRVSGPWLGV